MLLSFFLPGPQVAMAATAPTDQDQYLEFQVLISRGGAVANDTVLRVYWSESGMRVEPKTGSATLLLPDKKERYSLDYGRKLVRKLAWEPREQKQQAMQEMKQLMSAEWKVSGPETAADLGEWQCTVHELNKDIPEQFRRHLPSDAKVWSAKNLEFTKAGRFYELLGISQPNLKLLGDLYRALPPGSGPIVRAQLVRDRKAAIATTINMVTSRTVPHDPARYALPKDFELLDVSKGAPGKPPSSFP